MVPSLTFYHPKESHRTAGFNMLRFSFIET